MVGLSFLVRQSYPGCRDLLLAVPSESSGNEYYSLNHGFNTLNSLVYSVNQDIPFLCCGRCCRAGGVLEWGGCASETSCPPQKRSGHKKLHLPEQAVLLVAVSVHWDRTSCRDLLVQLLFCSLLCSQMMQNNNKQCV